ncbi:MAG: hypothetical protein JWN86_3162 [Planctomycetota bacterium]|nr:hypothetical protein [Planctomycetota bacterium]
MSRRRSATVSKLPILLLGIMSIASFGGPFGLVWILSGGRRSGWPPDRLVEWASLLGVSGLVVGLLMLLLALSLANLKAMKAETESEREGAKP